MKKPAASFRRREGGWALACLLGLLAWCGSVARAEEFVLEPNAAAVLNDPELFTRFARPLRQTVERELPVALADNSGRVSLLLALRVHLALAFGDDARALDTVRLIRERQSDPDQRAYAGVLTEALVAAGRDTRDPAAPFATRFSQCFAQRLAALPSTPGTLAVLREESRRTDSLSGSYLDSAAARFLDALGSRRHCSWREADALVRLRHRRTVLLPLHDAIAGALTAAIAARTTP